MMNRVISLSILAAIAALPPAASAAPVEAPTSASADGRDLAALEHRWAVPLMFNSFDTNKDGYISRQEASASSLLAREFNQLDKDGDGRLSVDELGAADASRTTARSGN
jgi:hypothetical protein